MKQRAAVVLLLCAAVYLGGWELVVAQTNAGFVQGLWYDRETLLDGEPVRIYAAIRNNTGGDLTGTVEFYVNGERIERNSVAALQNRIIESWADWTPAYGTSTITATLSRTELSSTASGTQRVSVVSTLTEDVVFVDRDTDGDGVGDASDADDDGDGISDAEEAVRGSDPLVFDAPTDAGGAAEASHSREEPSTGARAEQEDTKNGPEGLERFFADSRAKDALGTLTEVINTTRTQLDAYRTVRNAENAETPEHARSTGRYVHHQER